MKKYILMLFVGLSFLFACNNTTSNADDEKEIRETAKSELIKRYDLPEGTNFSNEQMTVNRNLETGSASDGEYIVKVTITSENRAGREINETHIMHYKKREDAMAAKERWELISFE